MQGGFVVVAGGAARTGAGWAGRAARIALPCAGFAQRGLVGVLGIGKAALVFDARQPRLHVVKLRGGHHVLVARRQDAGNLLLRVKDAVGGLGVVGKYLGYGAGLALFQRANLFKERDVGLRVVAGAVHILHAQVVGLLLV